MNRKYYNLSIYRLLAIFLVLQFHILFIALPTDLGLWTVLSKFIQGLTALSGLLMARKAVDDVKGFYWSRLKRLIIPLLVALLVMILWNILYMLITGNYDFAGTFIGYTSSNHRLMIEFGNFYYVLFVIGCYLLVPLFKKFKASKYVVLALAIGLESLTALFTNPLYIVSSFVIGYIVGEKSFEKYVELDQKARTWRYMTWLLLMAGSLSLSIYLYKAWWWTTDPLKLIPYNLSLATFGVSSMFVIVLSLKFVNKYNRVGFLDFTDQYTYYIFLFNQAFMCGAMNVASYVSPFWAKTLMVYAFVIVFAFITYFFVFYFTYLVKRQSQKNIE